MIYFLVSITSNGISLQQMIWLSLTHVVVIFTVIQIQEVECKIKYHPQSSCCDLNPFVVVPCEWIVVKNLFSSEGGVLNRHEDILDLNILTLPHSKSHLILFFISSVIHPCRGYCPWGIAKWAENMFLRHLLKNCYKSKFGSYFCFISKDISRT